MRYKYVKCNYSIYLYGDNEFTNKNEARELLRTLNYFHICKQLLGISLYYMLFFKLFKSVFNSTFVRNQVCYLGDHKMP